MRISCPAGIKVSVEWPPFSHLIRSGGAVHYLAHNHHMTLAHDLAGGGMCGKLHPPEPTQASHALPPTRPSTPSTNAWLQCGTTSPTRLAQGAHGEHVAGLRPGHLADWSGGNNRSSAQAAPYRKKRCSLAIVNRKVLPRFLIIFRIRYSQEYIQYKVFMVSFLPKICDVLESISVCG